MGLGLLLGTEAPVITPDGVDFSFYKGWCNESLRHEQLHHE